MSLTALSLGERIRLAARLAVFQHIREELDDALWQPGFIEHRVAAAPAAIRDRVARVAIRGGAVVRDVPTPAPAPVVAAPETVAKSPVQVTVAPAARKKSARGKAGSASGASRNGTGRKPTRVAPKPPPASTPAQPPVPTQEAA
jgi:hypothetical protein